MVKTEQTDAMLSLLLPVVTILFSVTDTDGISICTDTYNGKVSSFPVTLQSPDLSWVSVNDSGIQCVMKVETDRILRLQVSSFTLAGQEPCSDHEEHLDIIFSSLSQYNRGITDIQRWCGQSFGPILESRVIDSLVYYPGPPDQRGAGFNITLDTVEEFTCGEGVGAITVGANSIYIYSPGFPEQYPKQMTRCLWTVRSEKNGRLLLDTVRFALETHSSCNYDSLAINNVKYCGYERVRAQSRLNEFLLEFISDHTDTLEGFVLKLTESLSGGIKSCPKEITVGASPISLQLPQREPGQINKIHCWWKVDSGFNNSVVLMDVEQFLVTASCDEFSLQLFDGGDRSSRVITSGCAPLALFQTVRSSSRFLYLEVELLGFGSSTINVSFNLLSSPLDAAPRVLYATTTQSFVFVNLSYTQQLGILLQGSNDNPDNYSSCIRLQVKTFPADSQALAINKYFKAFSGWNESFAELTTSCGRRDVQSVISHGSKLFLTYQNTAHEAVWLVYSLSQYYCEVEAMNLQSQPNVDMTLISDTSYLRSTLLIPHLEPSYLYPLNSYCRWIIKPQNRAYFTQVKVVQSNLYGDFCLDNVTAYDFNVGLSGQSVSSGPSHVNKLLTWCQHDKPTILSSRGNGLLLEFVSDSKFADGGFNLTYSSVSLINECPSIVLLTAQNSSQYIVSPNYPDKYPNNVDCQWRIMAQLGYVVKLVVNVTISKETPQCSVADFLVIYDGSDTSTRVMADLCGAAFGTFNSSSRNVLIHFHSNSDASDRGFRLQYSAKPQINNYPCGAEVLITDNLDVQIASPFYPDDYLSNTDCSWLVLAPIGQIVVLEVINLDLPCQDGTVALYDGRTVSNRMVGQVCDAHNQQRYTSTQQVLYVYFSTSSDATHRGFKFQLRSRTYASRCNSDLCYLMAYTTTNYFTSPLYPNDYPPNSNYVWRIESAYSNMTVRLDVEDIKLESSFSCDYDYVTVSDGYGSASHSLGKFCGEHKETFWSSGTYLYVTFISDSVKQFKGFRMAYTAVSSSSSDNKADTGSDNTVGAVIGGVLGGIIFLLLGITAVLCGLVRCGRLNRHSTHASTTPREQRNEMFVLPPVIVNAMPPPPYPGITNPAFTCDEMSPPFFSGSLSSPPPYRELDAPPPYNEVMMESHPPSPSCSATSGGVVVTGQSKVIGHAKAGAVIGHSKGLQVPTEHPLSAPVPTEHPLSAPVPTEHPLAAPVPTELPQAQSSSTQGPAPRASPPSGTELSPTDSTVECMAATFV